MINNTQGYSIKHRSKSIARLQHVFVALPKLAGFRFHKC
jgi:hypothetical protein